MKKLLAIALFAFLAQYSHAAEAPLPKLPDYLLSMQVMPIGGGYYAIGAQDLETLVQEVIEKYREAEKRAKSTCL